MLQWLIRRNNVATNGAQPAASAGRLGGWRGRPGSGLSAHADPDRLDLLGLPGSLRGFFGGDAVL